MKTYKNLFDSVCSFENLYIAYLRAVKGKRITPDIDRFSFNMERELIELERELKDGSYRPGEYHQFIINLLFTNQRSASSVLLHFGTGLSTMQYIR